MYWIYFDWNIISKFNNETANDDLEEIFSDLLTSKKVATFFTDDHIWEAVNIPKNHENYVQIINSSLKCIDKYMPFYFEKQKNSDNYLCWKTSAFEVYRQKKEMFSNQRNNFNKTLNEVKYSKIKELSEMPDKLSPNYLNNLSVDNVINEINTIINSEEVSQLFQKEIQPPLTFTKILNHICSSMPNFRGLSYEFISQAYLLLNALGFRKDKVGNEEFLGSWMDTHHLRNSSICEMFITNDNKLRLKAKVIFSYLEIDTKVKNSLQASQLLRDKFA